MFSTGSLISMVNGKSSLNGPSLSTVNKRCQIMSAGGAPSTVPVNPVSAPPLSRGCR